MSPSASKFQDSDVAKGVMNGPRPLPLRINKDSHVIHKAHSDAAAANNRQPQPVIIYTHSPKVIHTLARAFMALVQSLTGLKRDDDGGDAAAMKTEAEPFKEEASFADEKGIVVGGGINIGYDDTTSVMNDDQRFLNDVKQDPLAPAVSSMYKVSNSFLIDAPLFTPNPTEFFCSSRPNSLFQSPNMAAAAASSISPSFLDYVKAYSDY